MISLLLSLLENRIWNVLQIVSSLETIRMQCQINVKKITFWNKEYTTD